MLKMNLRKTFYLVTGFLLMAPMAVSAQCFPISYPGCASGSGTGTGTGTGFGGGSGWNAGNYGSTGLPSGSVAGIVENIAFWLLAIFGFVGVIGFVISGIFYLTAAGDAEQEKRAKKALTMSIIGVVVGLVGLVVIQAADALLSGGDSPF